MALPKQFIHGSQDQLRSIYGLDMSGIIGTVKDYSLDRRIFSEGFSRQYLGKVETWEFAGETIAWLKPREFQGVSACLCAYGAEVRIR